MPGLGRPPAPRLHGVRHSGSTPVRWPTKAEIPEKSLKKAPELTAERLREVLHYDPETGVFTWKVAASRRRPSGSTAGTRDNQGYTVIRFEGNGYKAHRLAWLYVHGTWPADQIDHDNRNKGDNRLANLREAQPIQNAQNRSAPPGSSSGHRGVIYQDRKSPWRAHIKVDNRRIHLGCYASLDDALAARKAAEAKYHPFAGKGLYA